jgi:alanyl-tRNA synthetase
MRLTVDRWRSKLQTGLVMVAGANKGKVTMIAGVSGDLCGRFHAGQLISHLAPLVEGKGGGKPELAQGGGSRVEGVDQLLEATYQWVEDQA